LINVFHGKTQSLCGQHTNNLLNDPVDQLFMIGRSDIWFACSLLFSLKEASHHFGSVLFLDAILQQALCRKEGEKKQKEIEGRGKENEAEETKIAEVILGVETEEAEEEEEEEEVDEVGDEKLPLFLSMGELLQTSKKREDRKERYYRQEIIKRR
jgi:hypothetical protein